MTRTAADALRRGFDNVLANWPLLVIRMAEGLAFTIIIFGAILGIVLGVVAASFGIDFDFSTATPESVLGVIEALLSRWVFVVLGIVALFAVLFVLMLIHCFIEAGIVRVHVDAERAAGPALLGPRSRYQQYTSDRWIAGAKSGWRVLFGIYNVIWGLWAVLLLIPFLPVAIGTLLMIRQEDMGAAAGIGCIGFALLVLFMIPVTIMAAVWSRKAIVIALARNTSTRDSIALAWREIRSDFLRHLLVALAVMAVGLAMSGFLAGFGFVGSFSKSPAFLMMLVPLRILSSVLNSLISGAMASWLTASFAALTPETKP